MSTERDLIELKEKIDNAITEKTKLEGQKTQLMSQIKDTFKVNTLEKAEKLLSKMKTELVNMKGRLDSGIEQFEEDYGEALNDF